jgi:lactoylglutathione lyase
MVETAKRNNWKFMAEVPLNLVVIRSTDLEKSGKFYQMLGLSFIKHRHGNGLEHLSYQAGQIVFEIYPQTAKAEVTTGTRLGFQVLDLASLIVKLQRENVPVIAKPRESEWGQRAVVVDPDGHRVELVQHAS